MIRLKFERLKRGWSQGDLSAQSGMVRMWISLIEQGRFHPYPVQLSRLADALGYAGDPAELLEEVG